MSYRRPVNLMLLYTVPFVSMLVVLIILLSIWSIHKHKEEQITELIETGRAISSHITANIKNAENPLISPFIVSDKSAITFKILNLKDTESLDNQSSGADSIERYSIRKTDSSRLFQYQRVIKTPDGRDSILSIQIPMTLSDSIHKNKIYRDILSFLAIGLLSVAFVFYTSWRLSKRISSGIDRELEETRLKALIELAGATAHEMRQPLAVVIGFSDLLKDRIKNSEDVEEDLKIIKEQCLRMDDIIKKMLNITHYKTIEYTDGVRIIDLHGQHLKRRN